MEASGCGVIFYTRSGSINVNGVGWHVRSSPADVTSKAAIMGLPRSLACGLASRKFLVTAARSGSTRTAQTVDYSVVAIRLVKHLKLAGRVAFRKRLHMQHFHLFPMKYYISMVISFP